MAPPSRLSAKPYRRRCMAVALGVYVALLSLIGWRIDEALHSELEDHAEESNRQFTRMFANENWSRLKPLMRLGASQEEVKSNPNLAEISASVARFARGTDLVTVKIFNAQGLIIYATDPAQIGLDRSRSEGFLSAVRGTVATELLHRDTVSGFDGEVHNLDLVASYVPVRSDSTVEAVVEVYTDRTQALASAHQMLWRLMAVIGVAFGAAVLAALRLVCALTARVEAVQAELDARQAQLDGAVDRFAAQLVQRRGFIDRSLEAIEHPLKAANHAATHATGTPEAQAEALRDAIERLSELRQVNQLEGAAPPIERSAFDPRALAARLGALLKSAAQVRQLQVVVHAAASLPPACLGDARHLTLALEPLLLRAVTRTRAGSVHLRLQAEQGGLSVDVVDTGEPLPASLLELLGKTGTDAAWLEAARPASHSDGAAGAAEDELACRLAAALVQAMGGKITGNAEPGRGTTISLWLPFEGTELPADEALHGIATKRPR